MSDDKKSIQVFADAAELLDKLVHHYPEIKKVHYVSELIREKVPMDLAIRAVMREKLKQKGGEPSGEREETSSSDDN